MRPGEQERPDLHHLPIDPDLEPTDPAEPAVDHRRVPKIERAGRARPQVLAAIALGGALGAPARYEITRLMQVPTGGFPWDIFWINVSGSLVLGFLLVLIVERFSPSRYIRPFLAVGFLGTYTTYSTYMVGADQLVRGGHAVIAATYVIVSALVGFAAVWLGILGGRRIPIGAAR